MTILGVSGILYPHGSLLRFLRVRFPASFVQTSRRNSLPLVARQVRAPSSPPTFSVPSKLPLSI